MATKKTQPNTEVKSTELLGRVLSGVVVSTKMKDTVVVSVNRFVKHPKYDKFMQKSKRFKAHDAGNTKQVGDKVEIKETRPISKDKHFIVLASNI
ncbi:MAG: 30S ribosomal protein S17 [Candidatus Zambryskibacteria bacterium]|nr:30S ribosomal protein S17 [Candidatus Zambryskibacteria bacterium]